jgi:hypothetical protein
MLLVLIFGLIVLLIVGILYPFNFVKTHSFEVDNIKGSGVLLFLCTLGFICIYYTLFIVLGDLTDIGSIIGIIVLILLILFSYGMFSKRLLYSMFSSDITFGKKIFLLLILIALVIFCIWLFFCLGMFRWSDNYSEYSSVTEMIRILEFPLAFLPAAIISLFMLIDSNKYQEKNFK